MRTSIRQRRTVWVIAFALITTVWAVGLGTPTTAQVDESEYFVYRNGAQLQIASYPYVMRGLNVPNANSSGQCGPDLQNGTALADTLAAQGERKNVIRAWFFQSLAQTEAGDRDWAAFDKTLAAAEANGMKVIATLTSQAGDCGDGGFKNQAWYQGGYSAVAPGLLASYRDYVAEIVQRYADDERIAFWQLVDGAEVLPAAGAPCPAGIAPAQILKSFATDVAEMIKSFDGNHLVSLGTAGGDQCGTRGEDFRIVHNVPAVDLCEYQDYLPGAMPGDAANGLQRRIQQCASLAKPLFVGEVGIPRGTDLADRATALRDKIDAQSAAGVRGILAASWASEPSTDPDSYDIGPGDPLLAELIANRAPGAWNYHPGVPPGRTTELALVANAVDDPDGDPVEIVAHTEPTWGAVVCAATTCAYTPPPDFVDGSDHFTFTVEDPYGGSATGQVFLQIRNDTMVVTTTDDGVDADPNDGVCATEVVIPDPPGEPTCTLRAAIQQANASPGRDWIEVPSGHYELTIAGSGEDLGSTGDLDILGTGDLELWGDGSGNTTVSAADLGDRVFDIHAGDYVSLAGLTVSGGTTPEEEEEEGGGGGVRIQGAPDSCCGDVELNDVTIEENLADHGGGVWIGPGPDEDGEIQVYLDEVDITANDAIGDGGGIWLGGTESALNRYAELSIDDSRITDNDADRDGGGLWVGGEHTSLDLERTDIIGNRARHGGGLWASPPVDSEEPEEAHLEVDVTDTMVAENEVEEDEDGNGGDGAGLLFGYVEDTFLRNVTVRDNLGEGIRVFGGAVDIGWTTIAENQGDGLEVDGSTGVFDGDGPEISPRHVRVINSTIAGNEGLGVEDADELVHVTITDNDEAVVGDDTTMVSSVIAGNGEDSCEGIESVGYNVTGPDCLQEPGPGTDVVYGLDDDGEPATGLSELRDNGGLNGWRGNDDSDEIYWSHCCDDPFAWEEPGHLLTRVPLDASSPLVDAAHPDYCPQTDQRQVARPAGTACDIGAAELASPLSGVELFNGGDTFVPVGSEFSYVPAVHNYGPDVVDSVTVSVPLSTRVEYLGIDDSCSYEPDSRTATCTFTGIEPGEEGYAEIRVRAPAEAGSFSETAAISALSSHDPNPNHETHESGFLTIVNEEVDPEPDFELDASDDTDGDGIHNAIDVADLPGELSRQFQHGTTSGGIHEYDPSDSRHHGHLMIAQPDPDRPSPEDSRVRLDVIGTTSSTGKPAELDACGAGLYMQPLSAVIVRCGSLIIEVLDAKPGAPVEVELNGGAVVSIPAGVTVYVDDRDDGTYIVEHQGGAAPITIALDGDTVAVVPEGVMVGVEPGATAGAFTLRHLGGTSDIGLQTSDGTPLGAVGPFANYSNTPTETDATPPVVTVTGVTDGATYTVGAVPLAGCSTIDEESGVAAEAQLTIAGEEIDGTGHITATCAGAVDNAENSAAPVSVSYTVQPSPVQDCAGKRATIVGPAVGGTVTGTSGNDVIWVPAGNHTINAGNGNDTICAGTGDKVIDAGAGNDIVYAGDGTNTIAGGAGNDTITSGAGNDRIEGGDGNDTIDAGAGNNTVIGGAANDKLTAGSGDDDIDGADGNDTINAGDGVNTVTGGAGNDTITSGEGADVIQGGDANDTIRAGAGGDEVSGGAGNDQLYGEDGDDTITGGAGNDRLEGGPGINTLDGNAGNNSCVLGDAGSTALNCKV